MAKRPPPILQSDVTRLLKGIIASGFAPARIEIEGGKITVYGEGAPAPEPAMTPLEKWRRTNGDG